MGMGNLLGSKKKLALHYSWSTEACARQALANVSTLLSPGGVFIGTMPDANVIIKRLRESEGLEFGNSVYWISFGEDQSMLKRWEVIAGSMQEPAIRSKFSWRCVLDILTIDENFCKDFLEMDHFIKSASKP